MSHNFIAADPFCLSDAVSCEHEALAMLGAGREEFLVGNVEFATEWTGLRIETIDVVSAVTRDDWTSADPVMCKRVEGWMERALELTLGGRARPLIREEVHLGRDPAIGPHPFCRYHAEWK